MFGGASPVPIPPVPEKRHSDIALAARRVRLLQHAADTLGQAKLAGALGCAPRTLRAYLALERGISTETLLLAADALDAHCAAIAAHAAGLREVADV